MSKKKSVADKNNNEQKHEIRAGQSEELLKELHILTREGKLDQDSRRKLKQIYHLYQFIQPLLEKIVANNSSLTLVDHGAGKSYLGFILYDLFFKNLEIPAQIYGIETRSELVDRSQQLAAKLGFKNMSFVNLTVEESITSAQLTDQIDIVTALHAYNTATDDAISFALSKQVPHIVLIPCCQAEVAAILKKNRSKIAEANVLSEIWRHSIHAREFGSHITNVLRCLQLEANGYQVTATELIGWEHSMKNELIIATKQRANNPKARQRLENLLKELRLEELAFRFLATPTLL